MIEILGLLGAIVMVVLVQLLRGLLSTPFARVNCVEVPQPSALHADFLQAQVEQLRALGFAEPRWLATQRVDRGGDVWPLRGVLRHADGLGLCWLGPAVNVRMPHRPLIYFSHRLDDGRVAISQPFDCYFALTRSAELVARSAAEPSLAEQWQAHLRWLPQLGSAPQPVDAASIDDLAGPFLERQRQALIARRDLREITPDLALPRFGFALRALFTYLRLPKAPADPRVVSPTRMLGFAEVQQRVQRRAPPRVVQWQLFAISVLLFMLAGALVWDLQFAVAILLVVLIHELGHFLAMRAFGYRNVHMLALPLVGGVAIGVDANPAATRRAWMSLMGPLPGIVIGWTLLALVFLLGVPESIHAPLLGLAIAFLAINYLNVLPIPPLDGAHVLESLLPPRWARVQTVFAVGAALLGALIAWQWGMPVLSVLALLQLPGLLAGWRLHGVERLLAAQPPASRQSRGERLLQLFDVFDRQLGPTNDAAQRLRQALQVEHRLVTRPMGATARLLTGTVYLGLLAVPVAALLAWNSMLGDTDADIAVFERNQTELAEWQVQAAARPLPALLADLQESEPDAVATKPVTADAVAAAELRLGRPLPDELAELYALSDGVPALRLHPLAQVVAAKALVQRDLAPYSETLMVELSAGEQGWVELPMADAHGWWWLGGWDESPVFYLAEPHPQLPGVRVVEYFTESPGVYPNLRAWLQAHWVTQRQGALQQQRFDRARGQARQQLADYDLPALLAVWSPPDMAMRMLGGVEPWPDPAATAAVTAAEQRLGVGIPAELRELLQIHDGFAPLWLLPVAQLQPWSSLSATQRDVALQASSMPTSTDAAGEPAKLPLLDGDLQSCLIAAGRAIPGASGDLGEIRPRLLWCADGPHAGWLDLFAQRRYARLRDWLIEHAVVLRAGQIAVDQG